MYDAREPLYHHDLSLVAEGEKIAVWNDGEKKVTVDVPGLRALGEQFKQESPPEWFVKGKRSAWPLTMVGEVLIAVAERASTSKVGETIVHLYGGSEFGPVMPDVRKAGLVVEDDRQTLKWT